MIIFPEIKCFPIRGVGDFRVTFFLQSLAFLDHTQREFSGNPGRELEGNVFVAIGSAVSARLGDQPDGLCLFNPLLWSQCEAVKARLFLKSVEFDGVKIRIVQMLPKPQEFATAAVVPEVQLWTVQVSVT